MRRPGGETPADIAAEKVAAAARDEQTRRETWNGVVGPRQQPDLLVRKVGPTPDQTANKSAVGYEPPVAQREELSEGPKLVRVGDHVQNSRPREGSKRGHDVTIGNRFLRKAVLFGKRQREIPADDQRKPQHYAIGINRKIGRFVRDRVPFPAGD